VTWGLQFVLLSLLIAALLLNEKRVAIDSRRFWPVFLGSAFLCAAAASCVLSVFNEHYLGIFYWLYSALFIALGVAGTRLSPILAASVHLPQGLCYFAWILLVVGYWDQCCGAVMPGGDPCLVRPASLTGSFLHYPLLIGLIALIALEQYRASGVRFYLISACFFFLVPFTSLSRSAGLVVIVAGLYVLLRHRLTRAIRYPQRVLFWILVAVLMIPIGLGRIGDAKRLQDAKSPVERIAYRYLYAASFKAEGNSGRLHAWKQGLNAWWDSNLLLGSQSGSVTNLTKGLFPQAAAPIAESSIVQQLVNFGLMGTFLFYAFCFTVRSSILSHHFYLRGAFWGVMVQTAVYQSIEVLSFVFILLMLPSISQGIESHYPTGHS
jgi:hypothetical protein